MESRAAVRNVMRMEFGKVGAHFAGADSAGWVGTQFVVGGDDLSVKPGLDGILAGEQCAESVSNDFALARIGAGRNAVLECLGHIVRKGDAELLRRTH